MDPESNVACSEPHLPKKRKQFLFRVELAFA